MADNTTGTELGIIQIESTRLKNIDNFLKGDENITRVECPFPNVTQAVSAFENCINLESFKGNLDSLQYGNRMFHGCKKLETYTGNLPSLTNGDYMFYYTSISEFTTDLPNLAYGSYMFYDCDNLKTFKSKLQNLSSYTEMFRDTKLSTFDGGTINISDTGLNFMTHSYLSDSKDSLTEFRATLYMTNTSSMFEGYTELYSVTASMDYVTDATNMFGSIRERDNNGNIKIISQCGNLEQLNCSMNSLQKGNHMLRDCPKLNENNTELGFFYNTLTDGLCMFQGTSFTSIPWNFLNLTRSKQMFSRTNVSGHLSLDMTTQFPKVSTNNGEWADPASYMFSYCPITSIDFNVSSLDNGISMFAHCTQLTQCTDAKFLEGGNYQSMFTESMFDEESVIRIFDAGIEANVTDLHIGMNGLPSENLKNKYGLIQLDYGYNELWCRGTLPYCKCHANTNGWVCETVQEEVKLGNMENLVQGEKDRSIVIVCNNI